MNSTPIDNAVGAFRQYLESLTHSGYVITAVDVTVAVAAPLDYIVVNLDYKEAAR
jgi:hypothetical protein